MSELNVKVLLGYLTGIVIFAILISMLDFIDLLRTRIATQRKNQKRSQARYRKLRKDLKETKEDEGSHRV